MTVKGQGKFVEDIRFPELEVVIPEVKKELLDDATSLYYIANDYFPVMTVEIHFYGGKAVLKEKTEVPQLLASVMKFGGTVKNPKEAFLEKLAGNGADLEILNEYDKTIVRLSF